MTLDQWLAEEYDKLRRFAEFWREGQAGEFPSDYPNELPVGDWDDQYLSWL